jgi:serine protease Do
MKRNVVAWAALIVSTAALFSSQFVMRTAPAAPQFVGDSQKTARALSDAVVGVADFVKPSVVQISVSRKATVRGGNPFGGNPRNGNPHNNIDPKDLEDMLKKFFGPEGPNFEKEQFGAAKGTGSGFIYDDRGHILTNNHVVAGSDKIVVTFHDGEEAIAKIVGTDPKTDVAVIKIDTMAYHPLPKGQSSKLKVGELVLAVGSPFGFDQTVTTGIVSALGRSSAGILETPQAYEDFVQTDAAINPGNSGGPLVDMDGRVIGINSAIATSSRSSSGVGFAIPIDLASNIADRLIKDGKVKRAAIGVALQQLTPALARQFGFDSKTKGVLVGEVFDNTPASKAGLKKGDVLTKFDDVVANNVAAFRQFVATSDVARTHTLTYVRDGQTKTAEITLGEAEKVLAAAEERFAPKVEPKKVEETAKKVDLSDFGIEVQELTPELGKALGYKKDVKGLLISKVKEDSPAEAAGLTKGLLITSVVKDKVNHSVESAKQFQDLTSKSDELTFYVQTPDDGGKFVPLAKPKKN